MALSVLELCAGGGGQALGLEEAGFTSAGAVEIDNAACETLRLNRPGWQVIRSDIRDLHGADYRGVNLLAAGIPCPPFSVAGRQLGSQDERDLFPETLRLVDEIKPDAVMIENVPGFASARFTAYRDRVVLRLMRAGYEVLPQILNASDFKVPQLRPRFVLVALRPHAFQRFRCAPTRWGVADTVGKTLYDLMGANGWRGATAWKKRAAGIAPTLVGGSKKHGGPDLGPTRAKEQWRRLGVDGMGIADAAPMPEFPPNGYPRLTLRMVARLQGFPDSWQFSGGKTAAYRQIGNAFPPPVAHAVGSSIHHALTGQRRSRRTTLVLTAG